MGCSKVVSARQSPVNKNVPLLATSSVSTIDLVVLLIKSVHCGSLYYPTWPFPVSLSQSCLHICYCRVNKISCLYVFLPRILDVCFSGKPELSDKNSSSSDKKSSTGHCDDEASPTITTITHVRRCRRHSGRKNRFSPKTGIAFREKNSSTDAREKKFCPKPAKTSTWDSVSPCQGKKWQTFEL